MTKELKPKGETTPSGRGETTMGAPMTEAVRASMAETASILLKRRPFQNRWIF